MPSNTSPPICPWTAAALALVLALPLASRAAAADPDAAPPPQAGLQALPPEVKRDAEDIARHLATVQDEDTALDCPKAVENARYGVQTMLEVGAKNVAGGYLPAETFTAMATPMRTLLADLTVADCTAATGNKRAFYQCISSDYNHVLACGKAHPY